MTDPRPVAPPTSPSDSPRQAARERAAVVRRWLIVAAAAGGLVVAAVAEGVSSGRWSHSEDVRTAAARLDAVPTAFGDWTSSEVPMDKKVLDVAEAAGHVSRKYVNRKNRSDVTVLLLCGPSGAIGAHTPEVCYAGNGYSTNGDPQRKSAPAPGVAATYWSVLFEKKPSTDQPLRVCWMWGTDGDWQAAGSPRTDYVLHRSLYKLYVVRNEPRTTADGLIANAPPDVIGEFLTDYLPEVKKALAPRQ